MNFKTTYILFGLLVCILVVFGVALYQYDESSGEATTYVLPVLHDKANPLKQDDIDQVVIERTNPAEKIVLARDPVSKRWKVTEPRSLRADRFEVDGLIRQIYDARRDEKFDKTTNLASLGLEPPHEVVTLKKGDERQVTLNI